MSKELFSCFFCGMPIMPGENVAGVICNSQSCQRKLFDLLEILSERFGNSKGDPMFLITRLLQTEKEVKETVNEFGLSRDVRRGVVELIRCVERELVWLDNFANPEKLQRFRQRIAEFRTELESLHIPIPT